MKTHINRVSSLFRNTVETVRWGVRDRSRHYCARLHRTWLSDVTFIGITGSAGKTTTKDLCAAILSTVGPCNKNIESGNDHELVDETVQATTRKHRFCVVEASATTPGYLDRSIRAIRPRIAVLTLIGRDHYSAFVTQEAIAREKGKLIAALPADGTAVLNIDDPHIRAIGERHLGRIIWVGSAEKATIRLLEANSRWPEPLVLRVEHRGCISEVRTRLHGTHLSLPVLCALGVALASGLAACRTSAAWDNRGH